MVALEGQRRQGAVTHAEKEEGARLDHSSTLQCVCVCVTTRQRALSFKRLSFHFNPELFLKRPGESQGVTQ